MLIALKNLNPFMRADTLPFMNMMNPLIKPGMMPGSNICLYFLNILVPGLQIPTINVPGIMPTNITNMPLGGFVTVNLNPSTNTQSTNQMSSQLGMMNPNLQTNNMMPVLQPMQMNPNQMSLFSQNMGQSIQNTPFSNTNNFQNIQGSQG